MNSICSGCSATFTCGAKSSASSCWCFNKPKLAVVNAEKSCLCEPCLDKAIFAQTPTCFRLFVSYQGTHFSGFQEQDNARTVGGELRKAIETLCGPMLTFSVGGRTDAGVHARGQVVSVTLSTKLSSRALLLALKAKLPRDMAVWRIDRMPSMFDARRQSVGKRYVYRIFQGLAHDPFVHDYCYHARGQLDVEAMAAAAPVFVGDHDFASFRASACTAAHARRYIWHSGVTRVGNIIEVDIRGNAFCMNMVRIMVGTLMEVGKKKMSADDIRVALLEPSRNLAGPTAKACGLTLEQIYYPDDLADSKLPPDAQFPRFPVTGESWPVDTSLIEYGPV